LNLVFDRQYEIVAYLQERLETVLHPPFTTIGIDEGGRIVGGWLFNDYNGHNVEISVALDRPLTRGMIRAVQNYVFEQLKCRRVTARCREKNEKSAKLIRRLGFHHEGRQPFYYGDDAAVIFGLTASKTPLTRSDSD
jgi:RimJ/RimL family protein N-acetyltransferase